MATKKQEVADLTAPDPFLEKANAYAGWVERNFRRVTLVIVALFAVLIASLVIGKQRTRSAASVTSELTSALAAYGDATEPSKVLTSTTPEALKRDAEAAMPKLEAVAKSGQAAGRLASLYLADLARRSQDHARAEQLFKAYASAASKDDPLAFAALEGAGYALEEQGKLDEALTYFVKMQEVPGKELDDLALKHQARIHELKGDRDAALKAYRSLVEQFPESKLRDFADQRIAALE